MHPILAERKRLALYLAAWMPVVILLTALVVLVNQARWSTSLALSLPLCAVYAFQCLPAWYLCRSVPLRPKRLLQAGVFLGLASIVSAGFWLLVGSQWAALLGHTPTFAGTDDIFHRSYPIFFAGGVSLFLLAAAASYLLIAAEVSKEAEKQALRLNILAKDAELRALKAQINPHFLFNSLNSVMALAGSEPAEAQRLCVLLSDFLRKSLNTASAEAIPLSEECRLMESYLSIEHIRFGPRLRTALNVEEGCGDCLVPPLILQPLAENCIIHGIAQCVEGGEISLHAWRHGDRLTIRVSNPCEPGRGKSNRSGIGLKNVHNRLDMLYGNDSRLDITERDGIFCVEISMPAIAFNESAQRTEPRP